VVTSQRDRLQRALIEIAAVGGYESVTVRKLTKMARVSTGSFYAQFKGTDDCLVSAYGQLMASVRGRIEAARSPSKPSLEQAGSSVAALLSSLLENPCAGRLALFEIFGAGPAAVSSAHARETELELALRQSLDRRGRRVAPSAAAWVTAGLLHCARGGLGSGNGLSPSSIRRLIAWGQACLVEPPDDIRSGRSRLDWSRRERASDRVAPCESPGNETELILSAVLRLATGSGYNGVSPSGTSKAAGVPLARFKRYFVDADDAYLTTLIRAARELFLGFTVKTAEIGPPWTVALCEQVATLSERVAEDPDLASLVFGGMLGPGLAGLTRREDFIAELASKWRLSIPIAERPPAMVAEASFAALWNSISRSIAVEQTCRLPERAAANSYRFLVPMIGGDQAAAIVTREYVRSPSRPPLEAAFRTGLRVELTRRQTGLLN
jgi:AcrR family transcriptional regulator